MGRPARAGAPSPSRRAAPPSAGPGAPCRSRSRWASCCSSSISQDPHRCGRLCAPRRRSPGCSRGRRTCSASTSGPMPRWANAAMRASRRRKRPSRESALSHRDLRGGAASRPPRGQRSRHRPLGPLVLGALPDAPAQPLLRARPRLLAAQPARVDQRPARPRAAGAPAAARLRRPVRIRPARRGARAGRRCVSARPARQRAGGGDPDRRNLLLERARPRVLRLRRLAGIRRRGRAGSRRPRQPRAAEDRRDDLSAGERPALRSRYRHGLRPQGAARRHGAAASGRTGSRDRNGAAATVSPGAPGRCRHGRRSPGSSSFPCPASRSARTFAAARSPSRRTSRTAPSPGSSWTSRRSAFSSRSAARTGASCAARSPPRQGLAGTIANRRSRTAGRERRQRLQGSLSTVSVTRSPDISCMLSTALAPEATLK